MEKKDKLGNLKLIRHAQSEWNAAEELYGYEDIQYSVEYIDPVITDKGVKQANLARENIKKTPFDFVFVSPLRRTLQTATMIFADNPGNPKIIALPYITENFGCAGEIAGDYSQIKREFKKKVDFSLVDQLSNPDLWYIDVLSNVKWKNSLLKKLKDEGLLKEPTRAAGYLLNEIKRSGKHPEGASDLKARVTAAKEQIKKFVSLNGKDKRYAMVSHVVFLNAFTTVGKRTGEVFENCEMKDFSFDW